MADRLGYPMTFAIAVALSLLFLALVARVPPQPE